MAAYQPMPRINAADDGALPARRGCWRAAYQRPVSA